MKFIRVFLGLFMVFLGLVMVCCPALYDTRRMASAVRTYYDVPSDSTLRALNEARAADRRDILIYEAICAVAILLCFIGFARAGKRSATMRPNTVVRADSGHDANC